MADVCRPHIHGNGVEGRKLFVAGWEHVHTMLSRSDIRLGFSLAPLWERLFWGSMAEKKKEIIHVQTYLKSLWECVGGTV